jgi:hypothetical protein
MPWYLGAGLAVLILDALWVAFILRGLPEEHDAKISEQPGIDRRTLLSRIYAQPSPSARSRRTSLAVRKRTGPLNRSDLWDTGCSFC